jgi:hypothetical protein
MKPRVYAVAVLVLLAALVGYRLVKKRSDLRAQLRQRVARMEAPPVVSTAVARVQDIAETLEGVGSAEAHREDLERRAGRGLTGTPQGRTPGEIQADIEHIVAGRRCVRCDSRTKGRLE